MYSYVKGYKDGSIVLVGSLMKIKTYNGIVIDLFKNVYLTFTIRDSLIWFLIFSRQDLCPKCIIFDQALYQFLNCRDN